MFNKAIALSLSMSTIVYGQCYFISVCFVESKYLIYSGTNIAMTSRDFVNQVKRYLNKSNL